jgi:hypothetical protein
MKRNGWPIYGKFGTMRAHVNVGWGHGNRQVKELSGTVRFETSVARK